MVEKAREVALEMNYRFVVNKNKGLGGLGSVQATFYDPFTSQYNFYSKTFFNLFKHQGFVFVMKNRTRICQRLPIFLLISLIFFQLRSKFIFF